MRRAAAQQPSPDVPRSTATSDLAERLGARVRPRQPLAPHRTPPRIPSRVTLDNDIIPGVRMRIRFTLDARLDILDGWRNNNNIYKAKPAQMRLSASKVTCYSLRRGRFRLPATRYCIITIRTSQRAHTKYIVQTPNPDTIKLSRTRRTHKNDGVLFFRRTSDKEKQKSPNATPKHCKSASGAVRIRSKITSFLIRCS